MNSILDIKSYNLHISDPAMSYHIMVNIALLCVCDYFPYNYTNENNRRIIGMMDRIIGEVFKDCRIE